MTKKEQKIKIEEGDAPEFIHMVNTIMETLVFQYSIKEIVFVKIKNWFDHKWLNYSGKTVVHFEKLEDWERHVALKSEWRDKITIPPFNPNRVIYNKYFIKEDTGNQKIKKVIHRYRYSNDNIHNRIKDFTSDGLVIWFSSNTEINQRGSIMAYRVQANQVHTWYATAEKKERWEITKTKGIRLNKLKAYVV